MLSAPSKESGFWVHEAKTYRVGAGVRIKAVEALSGLSRATISRIEGDSPVGAVSANAYLKALVKVAPNYPHKTVFTNSEKGKHGRVVKFPSGVLP